MRKPTATERSEGLINTDGSWRQERQSLAGTVGFLLSLSTTTWAGVTISDTTSRTSQRTTHFLNWFIILTYLLTYLLDKDISVKDKKWRGISCPSSYLNCWGQRRTGSDFFISSSNRPKQGKFLWILLSKSYGQTKPFWLWAITSNWAQAWDVTQRVTHGENLFLNLYILSVFII